MCGIFSIYSKHTPINREKFKTALNLLHHRGPDESHIHLNSPLLGFGHTRLSIVGIENGTQPLIDETNGLTAIINGEFYDYKSIREKFISNGYRFQTETDSEIIFPLYKKHGTDCFKILNGEYAGILYDETKKILIAFRDRHGVKPLFYKQSNNGIAFSSEIKSIIKFYEEQPEYNITNLKDRLFGPPVAQDKTFFKDIYQIKPGHYVMYNLTTNKLTQHRYWQVNYDRQNYFDEPLQDLLPSYKNLIVRAVEKRLVADIPVASYLSGGIDSSVCYGIASSLLGKGLDAFTISFADKAYDEQLLAKKLVNKYAGQQYILRVDDKMLADNFSNYLWYLESTTFNPHGIAKYLLSDLVRKNNYKVVLTGEGSDEYNCGYITSVIDAMHANNDFDNSAIQEKLGVNKGVMLSDNAERLPIVEQAVGFDMSFFSNSVTQIRLMNELLCEEYQDKDPLEKIAQYLNNYPLPSKNWDPLNISLYYQSLTTFTYVLTALGDRTEMGHSVEARLPFLDNDVISFICRVNPKYKFYKDIDKFMLRESCKEFVTKEHYSTKKHPYIAPPTNKNSIFNQMMHDEFSSTHFINRQIFNHKKVLNLLNKMEAQPKVDPFLNKILFTVLSFAILDRIFNFK